MSTRTRTVATVVSLALIGAAVVAFHWSEVEERIALAEIHALEAERAALEAELEGWTPACLSLVNEVADRFPMLFYDSAYDRHGACAHLIDHRPGELDRTMVAFLR